MSKQTRKKSSKSAASKAAGTSTEAVAKKSSKTGTRTKASTITGTGRVRQPAPSLDESSHKLAAKALRASTGKSTTPAAEVGSLSEGGKAPDFTLPRDGGSSVTLKSFAGRKARAVFLSARRHARLYQGGHRFHAACRAPSPKAGPRCWEFPPTRPRRRKPFETSTGFPYLLFRTKSTRCWRLTVPGERNPCMAGPSKGFFARRF